jgi:hypothetical protein
MKSILLWVLVLANATCFVSAAEFERPVRLMSGNKAVRVDSPGYAAPCWVDLKGNGHKQLLVGQFAQGKIRIFEHLGGEHFGPSQWLRAEGTVAEVPGVW